MMTKRKGKRKNRSGSDGQSDGGVNKVKQTGGPSGDTVLVSEVLNQTNSVLYDSDSSILCEVFSPLSDKEETPFGDQDVMASADTSKSNAEPSNADIMKCLVKIDGKLGSLESRIGGVEQRLSAPEIVKDKVSSFDRELKKLWNVLEDRQKKTDDRLHTIEEKVDRQDFTCGLLSDKINSLEKEKDVLKNEVIYLQSQSMRNNLVFSNILEARGESNEEAEVKVRQFLHENMKIAKDLADKIVFDRVHRMGTHTAGKTRRIVAKFHEYWEKESVRKQGKTLQGTNFFVSEQFPKEIADKRRKLVPRMKAARAENKRAWIAYDTLYVDGRAVRD